MHMGWHVWTRTGLAYTHMGQNTRMGQNITTMHFNSKTTPTTDNDFSCHIKTVEFV